MGLECPREAVVWQQGPNSRIHSTEFFAQNSQKLQTQKTRWDRENANFLTLQCKAVGHYYPAGKALVFPPIFQNVFCQARWLFSIDLPFDPALIFFYFLFRSAFDTVIGDRRFCWTCLQRLGLKTRLAQQQWKICSSALCVSPCQNNHTASAGPFVRIFLPMFSINQNHLFSYRVQASFRLPGPEKFPFSVVILCGCHGLKVPWHLGLHLELLVTGIDNPTKNHIEASPREDSRRLSPMWSNSSTFLVLWRPWEFSGDSKTSSGSRRTGFVILCRNRGESSQTFWELECTSLGGLMG